MIDYDENRRDQETYAIGFVFMTFAIDCRFDQCLPRRMLRSFLSLTYLIFQLDLFEFIIKSFEISIEKLVQSNEWRKIVEKPFD